MQPVRDYADLLTRTYVRMMRNRSDGKKRTFVRSDYVELKLAFSEPNFE